MAVIEFLWPFKQYRNADSGSALERAAAYRHNRQLARGLPTYLNRWLAICCLLLSASVASPPWLAPVVATAFTIAFCVIVHMAHIWLLFLRN